MIKHITVDKLRTGDHVWFFTWQGNQWDTPCGVKSIDVSRSMIEFTCERWGDGYYQVGPYQFWRYAYIKYWKEWLTH